jgi:DNA-binding NtrC family response regulator
VTREGRPPRVLVVDPDFQIRDVLQSGLEDIGLEVVCARSGAEAREHLARETYDLAVVAVMLADEPGESLADFIAGVGTQIILISGHPDGIRRGEAAVYDFLAKPFSIKQALRLVLDKLPSWPAG